MTTTTAAPAPDTAVDLLQNAEAAKAQAGTVPPMASIVGARECVAEPKWDGWRLAVHVADGGAVALYSRTAKSYSGRLAKVESELAENLPAGTWLDCEAVALTVGEQGQVDDWGSVQSVLGSDDPGPKADLVTLVCFDLIAHGGIDARALPFARRRALLERIFDGADWERVTLSPQLAPTDESVAALLAQGFEGAVVKDLSAPYRSGKRGAGWTKVKPQTTLDAVVTGYVDGKNGFAGLVGAIVFSQMGEDGWVERGRCSGMTMKVRKQISDDRAGHLGRVCEIAHMGIMETGALRHPQWKRWRDGDKDPADCVVSDA